MLKQSDANTLYCMIVSGDEAQAPRLHKSGEYDIVGLRHI